MAPAVLIGVASLMIAQPALACPVCVGGDPGSMMSQGLQAGVLVLLGVVGAVLAGIASLLLFWVYRAAHIEEFEAASPHAPDASGASFSNRVEPVGD